MNAFALVLSDIFNNSAERRLSLEDERSAIAAAQQGDQDALVALCYAYAAALRSASSNLRRAATDHLLGAPVDVDDVESAAVAGLIDAVYAFDPEKYDRLAALAPSYIADSLSEVNSSAAGFRVPARTLTRFFGVLREAKGDAAFAARLAPERSMTTETFLDVLAALRVEGYHVTDGEDENGSGAELDGALVFDGAVTRTVADVEDQHLVEAAFAAVDTLEGDVCRLAYGFADFDPQSDDSVGVHMGLSRQKVQRVRTGALVKMRAALGVVA